MLKVIDGSEDLFKKYLSTLFSSRFFFFFLLSQFDLIHAVKRKKRESFWCNELTNDEVVVCIYPSPAK